MLGFPLLAVLTGGLLAVSLAPFAAPLTAWIAFAPLLASLRGATQRTAPALGALAGSVYFFGGGHGVAGYDATLALALPVVGALVFALYALAAQRVLASGQRAIRVLGPALLWSALECLWALPAIALPLTPAIALVDSPALGLASVAGAPGLSFAMVLSAAAIVEMAPRLAAGSLRRRAGAALAAVSPALLALVAGSFADRAADPTPARSISYHAVQPAIPFERAAESWWVPAYRRAIRARFDAALAVTAETPVDLFLWPEGGAMLGDLASGGAAIVPPRPGGPRAHLVNAIDLASDGRRQNRIFALQRDVPPQIYEKRGLVPIAERGYRRGEAQPVFDTGAGRVGSLVCFEVCFAANAREQVARGAELLFVSTNDGAFGATALALLHRDHARLRAVETGRPVLFISNDGPSAEIDPHGRIERELALGARGVLAGDVAVGARTTLHQRIAPGIAPLLWISASLVLLATRRRRAPARPIRAHAWVLGAAVAAATAVAIASASQAILRRVAANPAEGGRDALVLPPDAAIADALGPAGEAPSRALAYVASHLGAPRALGEVATQIAGATADAPAFAAAAEGLGFAAAVEALDYDALRSLRPPVVAPLADARLLVVMEVTRDAVRAFDPARGFVSLARKRFERAWSGKVVTIRPAPKEGPRRARVDHVAETAN